MEKSKKVSLYVWLSLCAGLIVCLHGMPACIIQDFSLDNHVCATSGTNECLAGWRCDTTQNRCVLAEVAVSEPGVETIQSEPNTEQVTPKEEPPSQEPVKPDVADAGPELPPKEEPPEQPANQLCVYKKESNALNCTEKQGCKFFNSALTTSTVALPKAISGAYAVARDSGFSSILSESPTPYIYLVGGGDGAPGAEVLYTKVDATGKIVQWKTGKLLAEARTNAYAFIYRNHLYVVGGENASAQGVKGIERAPLNADGSMGDFIKVGTWDNARPKAGIVFMYGHLYFVGGLGSDGKPSKDVEHALILPDGQVGTVSTAMMDVNGTPEAASLPEGRIGPVVATEHFIYVLGPGATSEVLMAHILPNGMIEAWCTTTEIPRPDGSVDSLQALGSARRILLFGLASGNKINSQLYFGALKKGTQQNVFGGGLETWRCSKAGNAPAKEKAEMLVPRKGAAAVYVQRRLYLIGGVDASNKTLSSIEIGEPNFLTDLCDLDLDGISGNADYCRHNYSPANKNDDQPSSITYPGDTGNGWVDRFGHGNVCEQKHMLLVSAGEFKRGSITADPQTDAPQGSVTMNAFYIDTYEVTNADYRECVTAGVCTAPKSADLGSITGYHTDKTYDNYPVVQVTYEMAKKYCAYRGKRLPTEAEWEKAARGLDGGKFPWGNGNTAPVCTKDQQQANYKDCKATSPVEVGSLKPGEGPYGTFDMGGNVREWVADFYSDTYYNDQASLMNPTGPDSGTERVIRGGSFSTDVKFITTYTRDKGTPETAADDLGFRCARDLYIQLAPAN